MTSLYLITSILEQCQLLVSQRADYLVRMKLQLRLHQLEFWEGAIDNAC